MPSIECHHDKDGTEKSSPIDDGIVPVPAKIVPSDRLLTVSEMAVWLQVKPRTIYQWVHDGYIPVVKLGALVRFHQGNITEWIRKREVSGRSRRHPEFETN